MAVSVTDDALAVIKRSLELASAQAVRLRMVGGELRSRFVTGAEEGDETISLEGVQIFVARSVVDVAPDVEITVTDEHDKLVLRPLA